MRGFVGALIALVLSTSATLAADPVGIYEISGTNPGVGSKYFGTAVVQRTGDTFQVTVTMGGRTPVLEKATISRFPTHWGSITVSPFTPQPKAAGAGYGHLPVVRFLERRHGGARVRDNSGQRARPDLSASDRARHAVAQHAP